MSSSARVGVWKQLGAHPNVPVLIAGGGINGAGLLCELALNGVDAVLVDKGDFCSGASAASSRLIHGGLRYLEYGEFRLVREALRERNALLQAAPHYVHPLPTTIPIFDWSRGTLAMVAKFFGIHAHPVRRGALLVKAGLTLYDWFTRRGRIMPAHRFISRTRTLQKHPGLNRQVVCSATYFDAWVSSPERLCLDLILDAERLGGRALNYVSVISAKEGGVVLRDEITKETVTVHPSMVVNATGAWIDFTNDALGVRSRFIGGTKGSHLVLDHPALHAALNGEMIYFENDDGRICLLLPFQGKVLAGTTDIPITNPDEAICDETEAAYILESVRHVFPDIAVSASEIVFRYCGVRPLARSDAALPREISRDHVCRVTEASPAIPFPIFSLVGGKWTTFRAFAEQVADQILPRLGRAREQSSAGRRIGNPSASMEVRRILMHEHVVRLSDLVLRRTSVALLGQLTRAGLRELALMSSEVLGWDAVRMAEEIQNVEQLLARHHGVVL